MTGRVNCCFLVALSLAAFDASAAGPRTPAGLTESHPGRIVVLNMYYAHPGKADEVLQTRLEASRIRAGIGLPRGRVLKRINDAENLPDVLWECEYPDAAAHDADMAARAGSTAFEAIRDRMRTRVRRFERTLWRLAHPADAEGILPAPGRIVVTNWYFAAAGQEQAVLDHRIHASAVRIALGRPPGRVLARMLNTGFSASGELPGVIWRAEYLSMEARRVDAEAIAATDEFQSVMEHMGTLLDDFDRGVWEIQDPIR